MAVSLGLVGMNGIEITVTVDATPAEFHAIAAFLNCINVFANIQKMLRLGTAAPPQNAARAKVNGVLVNQ